ncbi:hypothetical protein L3X38_025092 [Prunus dulcis]|uniref:Uncharacterized protein n=1 Tax=Prunus dulcis TaxID=3755 RepID=A0AAD4Z744_PRUDU|nr:hypothetical protein L3X38_025092 [Prunus dulcis]
MDEFRQHLDTVLEVGIGINTYVPPEERTEMTPKSPQSKPNPVAVDYVTTLCITKLSSFSIEINASPYNLSCDMVDLKAQRNEFVDPKWARIGALTKEIRLKYYEGQNAPSPPPTTTHARIGPDRTAVAPPSFPDQPRPWNRRIPSEKARNRAGFNKNFADCVRRRPATNSDDPGMDFEPLELF